MSIPLGFEDDDRVESLPQSVHVQFPSHNAHNVATGIPAGSAVSHSAPWSQINTRVGTYTLELARNRTDWYPACTRSNPHLLATPVAFTYGHV